MAKRSASRGTMQPAPAIELDVAKFENVHQVAGVQTAVLSPETAHATRVALVNTGSGLRFTVALDRGGDIVEASFNRFGLAYLTPNGYKPPNHAYLRGLEWLYGWPGGLLTTCGPQHIGGPRDEDGVEVAVETNLHGHHSNCPATVEMLVNPDPHRGRHEMLISMIVRDSRMFGPTLEVRRTIQCSIGLPEIRLYDQVTNRGDARCRHNWLYHVNLGYPLLDRGCQFIYRGKASYWQSPPSENGLPSDAALNRLKRVPDPLPEHVGTGERGMIVQVVPDRRGECHVGLINRRRRLGFELTYPAEQLPRVANWQHYGPRGSYVTGIEPFSGLLTGPDNDSPGVGQHLDPGETRCYQMTMRVLDDSRALNRLAKHDGKVTGIRR